MTLKEEYYNHVLKKPANDRNKRILFDLVADFTDRRGLRQEWEQIDEDVQEEIFRTWLRIIKKQTD